MASECPPITNYAAIYFWLSIIWIRRRHLRTDCIPPIRQAVAATGRECPSRSSAMFVRLARIALQIVELKRSVLVPLDELPPAFANCPARHAALVAVVRIVPKQRTLIYFFHQV